MGIMKCLNQFLKRRGARWHYVRRVPRSCYGYDQRRLIQRSLETEALEVARVRRDAMAEADEGHWARLRAGSGDTANGDQIAMIYRSAVTRAMAKGFIYTPVYELAENGDLRDIVERVQNISKDPDKVKQDADALLGTVERPKICVTEALELYATKISIDELIGKSQAQRKSWRKVKQRAVNNFVALNGDLDMDEITREHARAFYNWWSKRLLPNGDIKPLVANSANRDLGNMRKLYRKYWEYEGDELRLNPFRNFNFGGDQSADIPHFDRSWFTERLLQPNLFEGLKPEATLLVYGMIETGCRPSELANLLPEHIFLDTNIPHISIRPQANRQLKSKASVRDIPLVGISLEAMKRAPNGFAHYRDRSNLLSASLMKAFRARDLLPTKKHRIYSFRHSFEKRMLEAGLDYGLRCLLMGHKNSRPSYGDGGSMEYRRDELRKIAFAVPNEVAICLPVAN